MIYKLLDADSPSLMVKLPETTVEEIKEKHNLTLEELYTNLKGTMAAYNGIGLSANQVGLPIRAFVMYTNLNPAEVTLFVNPTITHESEETSLYTEGCLTYPNLFVDLKRSRDIKFTYMDINGDMQEGKYTGLSARVFLHEYDHMEGRNFTQLASKLKLDRARKKAVKMVKKHQKVA
jgi:peptide deformylase